MQMTRIIYFWYAATNMEDVIVETMNNAKLNGNKFMSSCKSPLYCSSV